MRRIAALVATAALAACATSPAGRDPQLLFFDALRSLCGKAFEGRVVTSDAADRELAASRLVMHVRSCSEGEVRIPFHAGEDRSRTWVISRTATGLRLKHDHRHEDGTEATLSQYGGDTVDIGTSQRQEFPVDAASKALFAREDRASSVSNVWAMEIEPRERFVYELTRPGREVRIEFDLEHPIPAPPPPWSVAPRK